MKADQLLTDDSDDFSIYEKIERNIKKMEQSPIHFGIKKRRRHRWLSPMSHSAAIYLRQKVNAEIMRRLITLLRGENEAQNDFETQMRTYILSETIASSSHKLMTGKPRLGKRSRPVFFDLFTWAISPEKQLSTHRNRTNHHPALGRYIRYRRALSCICDDHREKYQSKYHDDAKAITASQANRLAKTSYSMTPQVLPSTKYLGLEIIASKSFWLYAIGMKPHLTNKTFSAISDDVEVPATPSIDIADNTTKTGTDIDKLSELGYSSEDELSYEYTSYDEHSEIMKKCQNDSASQPQTPASLTWTTNIFRRGYPLPLQIRLTL